MAHATAVSIFEALPASEKRFWEEERRAIRGAINRAKSLPKRRREALMYCTNLWFHHRHKDGFIRPGAENLAEKLECCLRTAKSVLKDLRNDGLIVAVDYEKGGKNATRYVVDLGRVLDFTSPRDAYTEAFHGEIRRKNIDHVNRAISAANRAKIARGKKDRAQLVPEPVKEVFNDPSDWVEVPF